MNFDYQQFIPAEFNDSSRVWIYQSNRLFTISEAFGMEELLNDFVINWKSHGTPVKGYANLLFGQFIILMADETATGVSGCSTDSSVRLIKNIEQQFNVQLFNREILAFIVKDKLQLLPLSQLNYAIQNGFINSDTLYFNNLVQTKEELLNKWIVSIKESWLRSKIKSLQTT
ncbi:MAG: hypothetical protein ACR2FN_12100 [Chitinophagaceae bacterium]